MQSAGGERGPAGGGVPPPALDLEARRLWRRPGSSGRRRGERRGGCQQEDSRASGGTRSGGRRTGRARREVGRHTGGGPAADRRLKAGGDGAAASEVGWRGIWQGEEKTRVEEIGDSQGAPGNEGQKIGRAHV